MEVGCAVIAASSPMTPKCIDGIAQDNGATRTMLIPGGGSSTIFGSDGRQLSKSLPHDQEGIVYADVTVSHRFLSGGLLDTVGHYLRPDVFCVEFRNEPNHSIVTASGVKPARQTRSQMYPSKMALLSPASAPPVEKVVSKRVEDIVVNGEEL